MWSLVTCYSFFDPGLKLLGVFRGQNQVEFDINFTSQEE